jgi:hypothetical protein
LPHTRAVVRNPVKNKGFSRSEGDRTGNSAPAREFDREWVKVAKKRLAEIHSGKVRPVLQQSSKLVSSYFTIAKDLVQQSWPDVFSSMDGNNGSPPVGMSQKIVTSFDTNYLESGML